ncbi:UNVERIFIED_CONTAM: hypothetical protein ABIE34_000717 [Jeotgalibacillus campisalis]
MIANSNLQLSIEELETLDPPDNTPWYIRVGDVPSSPESPPPSRWTPVVHMTCSRSRVPRTSTKLPESTSR